MYPLYVISGISGSGKSTIGKHLKENLLDNNILFIEQDDYFLEKKPKIILSNGQRARNWDCFEALDPLLADIIRKALLTQPVLIYGFALCRQILPVLPTIHVHLVTANNPEQLETRCINARLESKTILDIERDALRVREFLIPFYHRIVKNSDITHLVPVFQGDDRIPISSLAHTVQNIMQEFTKERIIHHTMNVSQPYHDLLRYGPKDIEGRKISLKWSKIIHGDTITLISEDGDPFDVKVVSVNMYLPSIGDPLTAYLEGETLARTLPGVTSIDEGRAIYLQWSSLEDIKQLGMMGIEVKLI